MIPYSLSYKFRCVANMVLDTNKEINNIDEDIIKKVNHIFPDSCAPSISVTRSKKVPNPQRREKKNVFLTHLVVIGNVTLEVLSNLLSKNLNGQILKYNLVVPNYKGSVSQENIKEVPTYEAFCIKLDHGSSKLTFELLISPYVETELDMTEDMIYNVDVNTQVLFTNIKDFMGYIRKIDTKIDPKDMALNLDFEDLKSKYPTDVAEELLASNGILNNALTITFDGEI